MAPSRGSGIGSTLLTSRLRLAAFTEREADGAASAGGGAGHEQIAEPGASGNRPSALAEKIEVATLVGLGDVLHEQPPVSALVPGRSFRAGFQAPLDLRG